MWNKNKIFVFWDLVGRFTIFSQTVFTSQKLMMHFKILFRIERMGNHSMSFAEIEIDGNLKVQVVGTKHASQSSVIFSASAMKCEV